MFNPRHGHHYAVQAMRRQPIVRLVFCTLTLLAIAPDVNAATRDEICEHIESAAGNHQLPVAFLTRLIWRESSFRPEAVSPKGAQGVAQFMPGTAAERGLDDPFAPGQAIDAAAALLVDLRNRFGNLGLAAAAYNSGPKRVANWIAGDGGLPLETERFVRLVTGRAAADWAGTGGEGPPADPPESERPLGCLGVVAAIVEPVRTTPQAGPVATAPWGAQVAGHFSRERALAKYADLQNRHEELLAGQPPMVVGTRNRSRGPAVYFDVRIPAETRSDAAEICTRLKAAGAGCVVRKS